MTPLKPGVCREGIFGPRAAAFVLCLSFARFQWLTEARQKGNERDGGASTKRGLSKQPSQTVLAVTSDGLAEA